MKTNLQSMTTRPLRARRLAPGRMDGLRLTPVALAWALCLAVPAGMSGASAQALPSGAATVQGQASITTQGNRMTVTSSSNAILNWQSFSIGAGQSVRFDQPTSSSQVLNRVLGNDPSRIFGQLSSNGRVWLLNPNGVLFGPTARVDVAGLVASTLNISDGTSSLLRRLVLLSTLAQRLLVKLVECTLPSSNRASVNLHSLTMPFYRDRLSARSQSESELSYGLVGLLVGLLIERHYIIRFRRRSGFERVSFP